MIQWKQTTSSASGTTCATTAWVPRSLWISGSARMRIMTNNPRKIVGLEGYGIEIVERVPLEIGLCKV